MVVVALMQISSRLLLLLSKGYWFFRQLGLYIFKIRAGEKKLLLENKHKFFSFRLYHITLLSQLKPLNKLFKES